MVVVPHTEPLQPFVEVLQNKPELFLTIMLSTLLFMMMFLMMVLQTVMRRGRLSPKAISETVSDILSNTGIQQQISEGKIDGSAFVQSIIGQLYPAPSGAPTAQKENAAPGPFAKVMHDITWDVSGIIGLLVTVVLLIAVVTRTYDNFPKEIIGGWTTILGFYFGKAVNPAPKASA